MNTITLFAYVQHIAMWCKTHKVGLIIPWFGVRIPAGPPNKQLKINDLHATRDPSPVWLFCLVPVGTIFASEAL